MKGEVLYRYALLSSGKVVDINDLEASDSAIRAQDFRGVSCGHKMIPVMGTELTRHFRHAVDIPCSGETYLHELGKAMFYQVYQEHLKEKKPFNISFSIEKVCSLCQEIGFDLTKSCKTSDASEVWDLTKTFSIIKEPDTINDGEFRPDILLLSENGDKLYIEIVVTHESTLAKIQSGTKIIEIFLKSEDDVQKIRNGLLNVSDYIRFHNFPRTKKENLKSNYRCYFTFFVMDYRGAFGTIYNRWGYVSGDVDNGDIRYHRVVSDGGRVSTDDYFQELVSIFKLHGRKVKNCFLCKYHALNRYKDVKSKPIFCKVYKKTNFDKTCSPSGALKCGKFYSPSLDWLTTEDEELTFDFSI